MSECECPGARGAYVVRFDKVIEFSSSTEGFATLLSVSLILLQVK